MSGYFYNKKANIMKKDSTVIISNQYSGKWIKIPLVCYEVIEESVEKQLALEKMIDLFSEDDKDYFRKIIKSLEDLDLVTDNPNEEIYYGMIPKVSIAITNKCNLNCCYCCKESNINREERMNLEELKKVVDNVLKLSPINLTISGGEPLVRKDFVEFIEYIKSKYDEKLILSTNATLIDEKMAKFISDNFYAVEISLDGYDEETCSEIRGKGVFNKVMKAIGYLKDNGCDKISISMVMGKYNEGYKQKFEELNEKIGTKARIRYFCKFGRGFSGCEKYVENDEVFYTPQDLYTLDENSYDNINTGHCNAGRNSIFIADDGYVYSCPNITDDKFKTFNILDMDLETEEKLYKKDFEGFKNFENLDLKNQTRCRDCSVNAFCNTCPAKNRLLYENEKAFEKYCEFNKKHLENILWK